ncbi:hypothetical protein [Caloramator sp. Dgby_cultured_2]|uniref:hypothetical protein n=1 Tax=Caloramator sp. Dgby_cultured_2 TaxID=3029174 RepID=UPI00237DF134|nr:hypothetical protein [Caloramator sp. Dgby_cultured_2]WDU83401.1 hypothetical protein PWK10_01475 [Caloramator sp. Dgby_cultured_2]
MKDLPEEYKIKFISISNFHNTLTKVSKILEIDINEEESLELNKLTEYADHLISSQINNLKGNTIQK